jgi:hypothetical protein
MDSTTTNETPACASSSTSVLDGEPEIVRATHEGDEERALKLLQEGTVDPNRRTCKGAYPLLHVAALSDLSLLAARLLELGALPDALDRDGTSAPAFNTLQISTCQRLGRRLQDIRRCTTRSHGKP